MPNGKILHRSIVAHKVPAWTLLNNRVHTLGLTKGNNPAQWATKAAANWHDAPC